MLSYEAVKASTIPLGASNETKSCLELNFLPFFGILKEIYFLVSGGIYLKLLITSVSENNC